MTDGKETLTQAVVYDEHGKGIGQSDFNHRSNITAMTGMTFVNGKELVFAVNGFGHMCFYERKVRGHDFHVPDIGSKFMPHCLPANMLFRCPQSFCYTGFVDEIVSTKTVSGKVSNVFFRGMYLWPLDAGKRFILRMKDVSYVPRLRGSTLIFENKTIAASITFHYNTWDTELYFMDDAETVIEYYFNYEPPFLTSRYNDWFSKMTGFCNATDVTATYYNRSSKMVTLSTETTIGAGR